MCKQLITIKFGTFLISLFPFPELLRLVKMCNILGCLYGVWKVFGRHLGSVWVTLDTVRGVQCANTHFTHFHQLIPFLPAASNYTKWAIFWGVRRVSGGCLGGVWGLSNWPWILPGGYIVGSIEKNPLWVILISCNIFSQWSHACQIGPKWPYYNFYCVWCFFSGLESLSLYQMSSLDNRWRLRQVMPIGLHQLVVDWSILLLWLLAKAGEKNSTGHFYQFGKCIWTKMISHTHCTCLFR